MIKRKAVTRAKKLVTIANTKSIISEQFRTIRTNISFATPDQELKTLLITSSTAGEGKSTNAANLGVVFAQEGKRVLLIDADMRKPTMHFIFSLINIKGLSTVLARKSTLAESICETPVIGLFVLTSGPIPPNPAELLASQTMKMMIADMRAQFDIIIFDAPPLLSVADAQIVAHQCDGTLLIVHAGRVERDMILKAKSMLTNSQATILGVVLNQYKMSRRRQKHFQYYGAEQV